jgi:predicted phosphodiesterase
MKKAVKFGIFADLHVDIMHDTEARLECFLDAARREKVDFIIQLGDFCYPDEDRKCICQPDKRPENIEVALNHPTYADKESIRKMYRDFELPSYHVIGNHDCDMCSKRQILDYYNAETLRRYKEERKKGLPTILFSHDPMRTGNLQKTEAWSEFITLTPEDFRLSHEMIDLIHEDPNLVAYFTGHSHREVETPLRSGKICYETPGLYAGICRLIEVK